MESDPTAFALEDAHALTPPKKKRRVKASDDLEARYLARLAREEARDTNSHRTQEPAISPAEESDDEVVDGTQEDDVPKHEALTDDAASTARDTAKRTVFLGNVSVEAIKSKSAKKGLLDHVSAIFQGLPESGTPHKIMSLRFRSTAFSDAGLPKKAAFAKKELMETTTKSTNAYVVYSTEAAARKAARILNGTVVLNRHLRADHVAHPAVIDHRRCVFVGNLGFVDEEIVDNNNDFDERNNKKKTKPSGDVEEGLWQTFGKAGTVESVRVVRDKATRVGKGFAYVQFKDENAVEAALLYNDKKYPPLLPRKLRVVRAKRFKKSVRKANAAVRETRGPRPHGDRGAQERPSKRPGSTLSGIKKPETFVFEGHRASSAGSRKAKLRASERSGKRPENRGTRRAAAFRAAGGKNRKTAT